MTTPDRTSSTPDGPPAGPPGFWDAVIVPMPFEGRPDLPPIAEDPPTETIDPGAFRELPTGPVPLRWGTDGPVIGYVTLRRDHEGTLLVEAAPDGSVPVDTARWIDERPRCGSLHPDGRVCLLNPGHHGRHGHAEEGTSEWWSWEATP